MILRLNPWRGALPRAIVLAVIVALLPLPAAAGEPGKAAKAGTLTAAVEKAAAKEALRARSTPAAARQANQASEPKLESWSFFKSPVGIAAMVVLVAGTGYAVYSKSHDRITAPGR